MQGHIDGVIVGAPDGTAVPALWECKSANAKNWRDIAKRGVNAAKPIYAAQIALYQAYLGLTEAPAVFTAVNKDTCELWHELVPFDARAGAGVSDKAVTHPAAPATPANCCRGTPPIPSTSSAGSAPGGRGAGHERGTGATARCRVVPDPAMIATYADVVFGYCDQLVPVRALRRERRRGPAAAHARSSRPMASLASKLALQAQLGGRRRHGALRRARHRREPRATPGPSSIVQTQVVLVDLDHGDIAAKRDHLVRHLGAPTLEVASGRRYRGRPAQAPPLLAADRARRGRGHRQGLPRAAHDRQQGRRRPGLPLGAPADPRRRLGAREERHAAPGRDPRARRGATTISASWSRRSSPCRRWRAQAASELDFNDAGGARGAVTELFAPPGPRGRRRRRDPLRRAVPRDRLLDPALPRGPCHPGAGLGRDRRLQRRAHRSALAGGAALAGGRAALEARRRSQRRPAGRAMAPRRCGGSDGGDDGPTPVRFTEDALAATFADRHAGRLALCRGLGPVADLDGPPSGGARTRCRPSTSPGASAARRRRARGTAKLRAQAVDRGHRLGRRAARPRPTGGTPARPRSGIAIPGC